MGIPLSVGQYLPPPCEFNDVTLNFTVTSAGRQFDRLGLMFFGDTEIFRTSTAEPTATGIQWTYLKDMSAYLTLFKKRQKIIFDLGNLIDDTYTAPFNATLTATFTRNVNQSEAAHVIIPISSHRSSMEQPSAYSLPHDNATNTVQIPRSVRRAIVSISACGQAREEFWFGNVLSSNTETFHDTIEPLLGHSPFREVQLIIDGNLAGVVWPFPIIFTGGVAPGLWRPIVGLDAFDLREREIDITPWLTLLCDGADAGHSFEIRVAGLQDDGVGHAELSSTVDSSWIVTGKIFLWLDEPGSITGGSPPVVIRPDPIVTVSSLVHKDGAGDNESLSYEVHVSRSLSIVSAIFDNPTPRFVSWTQNLNYTHYGNFTKRGVQQSILQVTHGIDTSDSGYTARYEFPVKLNTSFASDPSNGTFSIDAQIRRGLDLTVIGPGVFRQAIQGIRLPASHVVELNTVQNGSAHYFSGSPTANATSFGITEQKFAFGSLIPRSADDFKPQKYEYSRHVLAANGTVRADDEKSLDAPHWVSFCAMQTASGSQRNVVYARPDVKSILGRGPKHSSEVAEDDLHVA
ncbi:MAG: hypothetical protein M1833_005934 [Piccolia ochrophora]|nr:MAG: hypothetical protein M1833_005934 [Piccolia ochrophora]